MGPRLRAWLRAARLELIWLEERTLPAASLKASLTQGVLRIEGTEAADVIRLRQSGQSFTVDGVGARFAVSQVRVVEVRALGGNDLVDLRGSGGSDAVKFNAVRVDGAAGSDTLVGGPGNDHLFGGDAADQIFGMGGDDYLDGGVGDDTIDAGDGNDTAYGDLGDDRLYGLAGNDKLGGGDGADLLSGADGTDWLDGGRGADALAGESGADLLYDDAAGNAFAPDALDRRIAGHFAFFDQTFTDPELRRISRWFASDGLIDREDIVRIFGQAESGGVVTAAEFADFRTLVGPDWSAYAAVPNVQWYGMPESVQRLAANVVFGDPANARYQGQALGNLRDGSSAGNLDKLVGKWFYGTDRPQASSGATYRYTSGALFQNGPGYRDVDQGNVGDCYFVAALAEVSQHSPDAIRQMFTDNGDGTFTVRFVVNGTAEYVTVDRYLPVTSNGREVYAAFGGRYDDSRNELWVALAEKAYAQLNESGGLGRAAANTYAAIAGGFSDVAMTNVTGQSAGWTWLYLTTEAHLISAATTGRATVMASKQTNAGNGVQSAHAYALLGYNGGTRKFSLYNPWGTTIDLTWGQIVQSFNGYWQMTT